MTKRERARKLRIRRAIVLGGSAFAIAIMVFFIAYFILNGTVSQVKKGTIGPNIYIANVHVSGLTAKEAKESLKKQVEAHGKETVTLVAEDAEVEVPLAELGFQIKDIDKLVEQAVSYAQEGNVFSRYRKIKSLEAGVKRFDVTYTIDENTAKDTITDKMPELENAAKDATIKRVDNAFVITEGKKGKKVDLKESVKTIEQYLNKSWKHKDSEKIELVTTTEEPNVTKAQLEKIQDVLGTYNTWFAANNNRGKNVALATSRINGTVLMPGEEYSVSTGMGSRNAANGYLEAGSYENGQTVQTYGGGICQVSSTLYNAVLLSELEVTERWPHSMTVAYVKESMDAAIAEGLQDFKFKNNTDAPIYIEGKTVGGNLTFTVYGEDNRSANRQVSYISEVTSRVAAKKKFVESNDPIGTLKVGTEGHDSVKAKLWKVVKENGVEVSRTNVNTSSYQMSTAIWNVGIATDNAEAKNIVKAAIATQDEAKIKAAIEQAKQVIKAAQTPVAPVVPTTPPAEQQPDPLQPEG